MAGVWTRVLSPKKVHYLKTLGVWIGGLGGRPPSVNFSFKLSKDTHNLC